MNLEKHYQEDGIEFVAVPKARFDQLVADAEMLADVRAYDAAKAKLDDEDSLPVDLVKQLLDAEALGERLALWRRYRRLGKAELGRLVGTSGQHIGMIESGKRTGVSLAKELAKSLMIGVEDLL